jgi:hypothetical protein
VKKIALAAAAVSALAAMPAAAEAQSRGYWNGGAQSQSYGRYDDPRYDDRRYDDRYDRRYEDRYERGYDDRYDRGYDDRYARQGTYRGETYRDGYERQCKGTTGTIVGGVAGALLGRSVTRDSGRYSRGGSGTTGTIIGGALGALAGRAVDKSSCKNDRYYR